MFKIVLIEPSSGEVCGRAVEDNLEHAVAFAECFTCRYFLLNDFDARVPDTTIEQVKKQLHIS